MTNLKKSKKIEKLILNRGFDTHVGETPYQDVASGVGLLKVMEKINELIDLINSNVLNKEGK